MSEDFEIKNFPVPKTQLESKLGWAAAEMVESSNEFYRGKYYSRIYFADSKESFEKQTEDLLNLVEELSKDYFPIVHKNVILQKLNRELKIDEVDFYSDQVGWAMHELERRGIFLTLCNPNYMRGELKSVSKFFYHRQHQTLSKDLFYNVKRSVFSRGYINSKELKQRARVIKNTYDVKLTANWEKRVLGNLVFQGLLVRDGNTYRISNTVRI